MDKLSTNLINKILKLTLIVLLFLGFYLFYYLIGPAIGGMAGYLIPVFFPFLIAVIFALLIDPLVRYLQEKGRMSRPIAVLSTLTFFMLLIGTITVGIVSRLIIELEKLSKTLPKYSVILGAQITHLQQRLQTWYLDIELPDQVINQLQGTVDNLIDLLNAVTTSTINLLLTLLAGLPGGLLMTIMALLATYFFSRDKETIMKNVYKLLPNRWEHKVRSISKELEKAIIGFLRAQLFLISITALQTIIVLRIMNIDYAFTMGIVVGLVDILPILGPGAVFIPWVILEFFLGQKKFALILLLLYGSIVIVRQLIQPKIIGEQVGIHPLGALIAMYVGLRVLGVWGILLGPMILVLIKAISKAGAFSRWI